MIDQQRLLYNTGHDAALAHELCETFVGTAAELATELQSACESRDRCRMSRAAHTLTSNFEVLGAIPERDLALQVEQLASVGNDCADGEILEVLCRRLLGELHSVRNQVRALLTGQPL